MTISTLIAPMMAAMIAAAIASMIPLPSRARLPLSLAHSLSRDAYLETICASTSEFHSVIQLSLDELLDQWIDVEAAVDATDGIDQWCSGPDWAIPVAKGFAQRGKRLLLKSTEGNGYVLLGYYRREDVVFLGGIEPLWGFASPIFGPDVEALVDELATFLVDRDDWLILLLSGLPPHPHPLTIATTTGLRPLGVSVYAEGITRRVADIAGGYDNWLVSRSSRFRRNLRQAEAKAAAAHLNLVEVGDDKRLFERLLAIEHHSWKGQDGSGITTPEMSTMYELMIDRLRERGRLQAFVAQLPTAQGFVDVGYILGGIRKRRYRGLQISFSEHHQDLSIGNLLQNHQLHHLAKHNLADVYDMGMDFEYKQRWADQAETSITLILHRSSTDEALS